MEEDFMTWPVFLLLLISLSSMIYGKMQPKIKNRFYSLSRAVILLAILGIIVSLYHDSTQILNLNF